MLLNYYLTDIFKLQPKSNYFKHCIDYSVLSIVYRVSILFRVMDMVWAKHL